VDGPGPGTPFQGPLGIFFDRARQECYVADTGNHQIVICDSNGMPVYRFHHSVERDGKTVPGEPRAIVVDARGRMFITDNLATYLHVVDHRGRTIGRIEAPEGHCDTPHRFDQLALGPGHTIYATLGCARRRIAIVDTDRLEVVRVVRLKSPDGDGACLSAIAVAPDGRVCVTDPCAQSMVQLFDADGGFLSSFGRHDHGFENFSHPAAVAFLANGDLWVVDAIRQAACRFTGNGEFIELIGGAGRQLGAFSYPSGIATDGTGRVFVLERAGNRYQCFEFESVERVETLSFQPQNTSKGGAVE
jgi:sugar lactone lactonase YvrE